VEKYNFFRSFDEPSLGRTPGSTKKSQLTFSFTPKTDGAEKVITGPKLGGRCYDEDSEEVPEKRKSETNRYLEATAAVRKKGHRHLNSSENLPKVDYERARSFAKKKTETGPT